MVKLFSRFLRVTIPAALLSVSVGFLISACDSAPGSRDLQESAPVVSDMSLAPGFINLDSIPPGDIIDGVAHITLSVDVTVTDDDTDAESLYIFVLPPDATSSTSGEEVVAISGNGRKTVEVELLIPVGEIGIYTVKAHASDALGQLGNQTIGSLEVTASSEPPVIEAVDIPATIVRPAPGEAAIQIPIIVTVSDPDGLANILRVEMLVNGSGPLFLCDDGGTGTCNVGFPPSGDVTAGDGDFTITIQLDSNNSPGQNTFEFKAIDRAGLESTPEVRVVEVQ